MTVTHHERERMTSGEIDVQTDVKGRTQSVCFPSNGSPFGQLLLAWCFFSFHDNQGELTTRLRYASFCFLMNLYNFDGFCVHITYMKISKSRLYSDS